MWLWSIGPVAIWGLEGVAAEGGLGAEPGDLAVVASGGEVGRLPKATEAALVGEHLEGPLDLVEAQAGAAGEPGKGQPTVGGFEFVKDAAEHGSG
jgi:hypothetical protein